MSNSIFTSKNMKNIWYECHWKLLTGRNHWSTYSRRDSNNEINESIIDWCYETQTYIYRNKKKKTMSSKILSNFSEVSCTIKFYLLQLISISPFPSISLSFALLFSFQFPLKLFGFFFIFLFLQSHSFSYHLKMIWI
jgi:hypothetical protein